MTKQKFDKLLEGCTDETLRQNVKQAIDSSIIVLSHVRRAIASATLEDQSSFQSAITAIDKIDILLVAGLPAAIDHAIARLQRPFYTETALYKRATSERRGIMRRKGQITQVEFNNFRQAASNTLDQLIAYLKDIKP